MQYSISVNINYIGVDVRLQYFMQYSISVNINFIGVDVRLHYFMQCSISVNIYFIGVDVRLQYFMQYCISVNINFILPPQCCSLFCYYKRKRLPLLGFVCRGRQHSVRI